MHRSQRFALSLHQITIFVLPFKIRDMEVFLDNMPEGCITEEQKQILIKHASEYGAHYLIYATEFDGIHYFHYGLYKDQRPRFSGFPVFYFFNKSGELTRTHYSICNYLGTKVGQRITGLLSTD